LAPIGERQVVSLEKADLGLQSSRLHAWVPAASHPALDLTPCSWWVILLPVFPKRRGLFRLVRAALMHDLDDH